MINGTYEDGVRDALKFLVDNNKAELINVPEEQFILLLANLSGRGVK